MAFQTSRAEAVIEEPSHTDRPQMRNKTAGSLRFVSIIIYCLNIFQRLKNDKGDHQNTLTSRNEPEELVMESKRKILKTPN